MIRLARLRAALGALLLVMGLAACSESVELLSAIPETEANEILATLLESGIKAEKLPGKDGMVGIVVDGRDVATALQVMQANGLPHERFVRMGDVFKKEGLVSSPLEERARYVYALSQELAETISQIDGVITARVHVVLPDRAPGANDILAPSSAAVFIKYKEVYNLETVVPQIKRLVTNSISNLSYDNVSVVLVPSMRASPAPEPAPATVSLLFFEVAPESRPVLVAVLAVLALLAVAGLGGSGVLYWLWRIKPKQHKTADGET